MLFEVAGLKAEVYTPGFGRMNPRGMNPRHLDPRHTNRRVTARLACRLSVRYSAGKDWHPATALDVSTAGCRLRVGEDLDRSAVVAVVFETLMTDGSQALSVEVPGTVMWSRPEGLSHQAGIRFESAPPSLDDIITALRGTTDTDTTDSDTSAA